MENDNIGALSVINLLPSTKDQVNTFANLIIAQVKSGDLNPLTLKAQLKFIEKTLDAIDKGIKDEWMNEASKYGKSFEHKGWRIEQIEAGTSYDFTSDQTHNELKEKIKEREKFLKGLTKPMADPDSGEICQPPIKKSTTTLKFTAI